MGMKSFVKVAGTQAAGILLVSLLTSFAYYFLAGKPLPLLPYQKRAPASTFPKLPDEEAFSLPPLILGSDTTRQREPLSRSQPPDSSPADVEVQQP